MRHILSVRLRWNLHSRENLVVAAEWLTHGEEVRNDLRSKPQNRHPRSCRLVSRWWGFWSGGGSNRRQRALVPYDALWDLSRAVRVDAGRRGANPEVCLCARSLWIIKESLNSGGLPDLRGRIHRRRSKSSGLKVKNRLPRQPKAKKKTPPWQPSGRVRSRTEARLCSPTKVIKHLINECRCRGRAADEAMKVLLFHVKERRQNT